MVAKNSDRLASLMAKREALDARIQRLKKRGTASDRKSRSRALLLMGVALEDAMKRHQVSTDLVRQLATRHLSKPTEREAVFRYLFPQEQDDQMTGG